jgi:hypothetical protein
MCCSHMSKQPFKWEVLRELRRNPLRASGRVVPRDGIDPAWLSFVSATLQVQTQIKALACGSVVDALYEADLVALTLLVAAGVLAAGCGGTKSGSGGYGDGAPATTATPSATDSGGRGAYGGRPTTSGAGTPASGTAVAIDNFAFSPATLKAKGGPAGHLDQQAGRRAHSDRQRGRVQPSDAVGGDVLVHLHQGGHLRLPLHDPPIDARDGRGVVATSGRFRVLKRQCCRATSPHSHRARDNRGAGAVRRPVGGAGRRPAGRVTAPRWP